MIFLFNLFIDLHSFITFVMTNITNISITEKNLIDRRGAISTVIAIQSFIRRLKHTHSH